MPSLVLETPPALKEYVGRELLPTPPFTVAQDRIRRFAEVTEDRQWIHVDPERARLESPFGRTVAHGFLTLSLLSHFLEESVHIRGGFRMSVNYGLNRVRFPSPVRSGSKVRARLTVLAVNGLPDATEAVYSIRLDAEGAPKPCCVAEWVIRYYR